jgi:DNA-binding NarL/FixJ family response regulator
MEMSPREEPKVNDVTIRRDSGRNRSFVTKSPIDPPMNVMAKIKTLIVHHVPLVRSGLVALIEATGRFAVCGETDDAPTGREIFLKYQPQIAALGLTLRRGDGIDLIKDFRKINTAARLLVVSVREDPLTIQRAFRAGTHGYCAGG